jgi:hypothetical protein
VAVRMTPMRMGMLMVVTRMGVVMFRVVMTVPVIVAMRVGMLVVVMSMRVVVAMRLIASHRVSSAVAVIARVSRSIAMAAPNPLSMFTTVTPAAQHVSIANIAANPPAPAP